MKYYSFKGMVNNVSYIYITHIYKPCSNQQKLIHSKEQLQALENI